MANEPAGPTTQPGAPEKVSAGAPKSWAGKSNPLTDPDVPVRRGPGRPRKDGSSAQARTTAGMAPKPAERPTEAPEPPAAKAEIIQRAPQKRTRGRLENDLDVVFAAAPPEPDLPVAHERDTTARRLSMMQDAPGEWMRLRVYASKTTARDIARAVDNSGVGRGPFERAFYVEGIVETTVVAKLVPGKVDRRGDQAFEYQVWVRFHPEEDTRPDEPPL